MNTGASSELGFSISLLQIYVSSNPFIKVSFPFAEILLYTMNKTEMDVGEIYYNNDGIQGAVNLCSI